MRRLAMHQRVIVHRTAYGRAVGGIAGTVTRLRRADDAAWVKLDCRHGDHEVHPFPADDAAGRATHVIAWPEDCEMERLRVVRTGP